MMNYQYLHNSTDCRSLIRDTFTTYRGKISEELHKKMDQLLQYELEKKTIISAIKMNVISEEYPVAIWKGDITVLAIESIVNAANSEMLGCFLRGHTCIDNIIHNTAGPRLREECMSIKQGRKLPTGHVKITKGYNLPAKYILHTVGPIISAKIPTDYDKKMLYSCYINCLNICRAVGIREIAFCNISTGVFGYPSEDASHIALGAVRDWLRKNQHIFKMSRIIFCVFTDQNYEIYNKNLNKYFKK
mgnify:CR=1 FL=1